MFAIIKDNYRNRTGYEVNAYFLLKEKFFHSFKQNRDTQEFRYCELKYLASRKGVI